MRHYPGVDVSRVSDPVVREHLRTMDRWLRDATKRIGDLSASTGGGSSSAGAAPDDEAYVVTAASGDLSNEKVLTTTSPLTGTVGAGTVTLAAPTVVTSAASLTDDAIVVGAGGAQGSETRGVKIDSSNFRLRETGGEWIGMASTTAMTAQQTHTAANTETTMHSEAQLSGILDVAGRVVSVRAFGTNSVDVTSTVASQIIRLKYGSTAVWQRTNTLAVPGGAYTLRWLFMADVITTSSGNVRCFGWMITEDSAGALSNIRVSDVAVARTPTTTGAVTVALTDQWDVNDANTTWTTEMCQIYLGGLTA